MQKSILRYPGGKSRAVDLILEMLPSIDELVSPFFGGGSVELACASLGIKTIGYDVFSPLVNFWNCAISDPTRLAQLVRLYHPLSKERFYQLQKEQMIIKDPWQSAAVFFVLNRASFSGSTLSGGMSPSHPRFNEGAILRLEQFKINNLEVKQLDFQHSIPQHPNSFLYCDPPYLIKNNLYGNKGDAHKEFDHFALAKLLKEREQWLLSYNDCPEIRQIYKDFKIIEPQWKYGMSKDKGSKELLIINF